VAGRPQRRAREAAGLPAPTGNGLREEFPPGNQAALTHGSYQADIVITTEPRTLEIFAWIEETQPVSAPCDRLTKLRLAVVYRRSELAVAAIDEADRLTAERPIAAYAVEKEWMPRLRADLDRWMSRATSLERELGRTPASRARLGLDIASARRAMTVVDLHEAAAEEAS
jgi:hypothetical protein